MLWVNKELHILYFDVRRKADEATDWAGPRGYFPYPQRPGWLWDSLSRLSNVQSGPKIALLEQSSTLEETYGRLLYIYNF